jgi:hypothetical protein
MAPASSAACTSSAPDPRPSKAIYATPYDGWTAEQMLAHHRNRASVTYFPIADLDETARAKIDDVLENRFDLINERHHLPEPIDWLTNPSDDLEWQILLHKFYFGVGLGMAYKETGDRRYADKWVDLVSSWIDCVQPNLLAGTSPLNSELFVAVMGRRIQNWIYAHHYFVTEDRSAAVPADFHHRFIDSLRGQVNRLLGELAPSRNHRTIELSSIFLAAVVFPELREADEWRAFALEEILANMEADLLADGVQCELSTDYHHLVLRNYLIVRRLAKLNDIAVPARMDELLRRALDFSMHVHKPDGLVPSLSDGDVRSYLELLEQGAWLYDLPELRYVATRGQEGKAPTARSKGFPDSGYYVLRSGWGDAGEAFEDERYMVFDCGPLGEGNHGHLDVLSFELAAFGKSLVVDPGRYTYKETGPINWRVLFRGTAYHNTVLVDGRNQTRYVPGKRKFRIRGPAPEAALRAFVSEPGFDYLHGIAISHEYDAIHERKILFLAPDYWVVTDLLHSEREHDYDLLFHLSAGAQGRVESGSKAGTRYVVAPNLVLAQPQTNDVTLAIDKGFVSERYGQKEPAPVVRFSRRATSAVFHTVLYPYRGAAPAVSVRAIDVSGENGRDPLATALEITVEGEREQRSDLCYVGPEGSPGERVFGNCTYSRRYLVVRRDADCEIVRLHGDRLADVSMSAGQLNGEEGKR